MSLWLIPLRLRAAEVTIATDRSRVFSAVTPFTRHRMANARVLSESDGGYTIEFQTEIAGLFGHKRAYRTVEFVTLREPDEVRFSGREGALDLLEDRFTFRDAKGGTLMRYESTVGLKGSVLGWLVCLLYARPVLQRFMKQHLEDIKRRIEWADR